VSLCIAWQVDFRALWDNDDHGRRCFQDASTLFGDSITARNLRLLPGQSRKRILQDLFSGTDLVMVRKALELEPDCSFERTMHALFYSDQKTEIVSRISASTRSHFVEVFNCLGLGGE